MGKIYKYCRSEMVEKIFNIPGKFGIKFSYLKDYNDPYEYFLTIDFNRQHEILAYYLEMINMHTTFLATCFSRSPINTPMWAHYGDNSQGFVLEIDEDKLCQYLKSMGRCYLVGNIKYKDSPDADLENLLERAYCIGKPRYVDMLSRRIIGVAYFTKQTCWSYEQERRIIVSEDFFSNDNYLKVLNLPREVITSIIVGHRASNQVKRALADIANDIKVENFIMKPGKIASSPFLINKNLETYIFMNKNISKCDYFCSECNEPLKYDKEKCSWCEISDYDKEQAALINPFRIMARYGLLEEYIENTNRIFKK